MNELFTDTIKVEKATGEWLEGRFVKGDPVITTHKCSVQPFKENKDKNTIIEPSGRRRKSMMKIFIGVRLNQSDEAAGTPADVVVYDGKRWEVHDEQNWNISKDIPYYRFIIEEIDGQGGGNEI